MYVYGYELVSKCPYKHVVLIYVMILPIGGVKQRKYSLYVFSFLLMLI